MSVGSTDRVDHRPVLVLQHRDWEHAGLLATALDEFTLDVRNVCDESDPALPSVQDLAGLVVMGGPMGALDDEQHPGLKTERALLAAAVDADLPVFAICLGMQLLAVSLGADLHSGVTREIGVAPVNLTGEGIREPLFYPLVAEATANPEVLHWHCDTVDAPAGAVILASTPATPVQAFRIGSAVGVQFHLEVSRAQLDEWLAQPEMLADLAPGEADIIAASANNRFPSLVPRALVGLSDFARQVRDYR